MENEDNSLQPSTIEAYPKLIPRFFAIKEDVTETLFTVFMLL